MAFALITAVFLTAAGGIGGAPTPGQDPPKPGQVPADRPQEEPAVDPNQDPKPEDEPATPPVSSEPKLATFGGGCFWCTEAVFELVNGVSDVVSGYAGGRVPFPSYEAVCSGMTGHAEVVQITYDPSVVSYAELLEIFWRTHDPTTLNRQGPDVGTQYRSVIFWHDEEQRELASGLKDKLNENKVFKRPVVTQVAPYEVFFPAEPYHQDYFRKNPNAGYCQMMIVPKLKKFSQTFKEKMR